MIGETDRRGGKHDGYDDAVAMRSLAVKHPPIARDRVVGGTAAEDRNIRANNVFDTGQNVLLGAGRTGQPDHVRRFTWAICGLQCRLCGALGSNAAVAIKGLQGCSVIPIRVPNCECAQTIRDERAILAHHAQA